MAVDDLEPHHQLGAIVSRMLAVSPAFASQFKELTSDGARIVVPAFASDTVVSVTNLVGQAGGRGTLLVVDPVDGDVRLTFASIAAKSDEHLSGDTDVPMTHECTIGDLVRVLQPGTSITYRILGHGEIDLEDVTREEAPEGEFASVAS